MSKFTKIKSKIKTLPSFGQYLSSLGLTGRLKLTTAALSAIFLVAAFVSALRSEPSGLIELPRSYFALLILLLMGLYFLGVTIGLASANEENKEKDNANNSNK